MRTREAERRGLNSMQCSAVQMIKTFGMVSENLTTACLISNEILQRSLITGKLDGWLVASDLEMYCSLSSVADTSPHH